MSAQLHRIIRTETDASRTVLEATLYCREAVFQETPSRMVATAVSVLVRNILKYAGSGEFRLRRVEGAGVRGIEIEVSDEGPGRADVDGAMSDHFSHGGTPGRARRGVRRLMEDLWGESSAGGGEGGEAGVVDT